MCYLAHRISSKASIIRTALHKVGVRNTVRLECSQIIQRLSVSAVHPMFILRQPEGRNSLQLRTGTSDYYVFRHVFCLDTYKPALPPGASPRLIIDCGANSGYSSAYFLQAYPEATVVSVEPDPRNAAVCRANLAAYGRRSKIVESAVWSHPTSLELITFGSRLTQNTQVRQLESPETTTVNAVDIPALIDVGGGGAVDLLKIDIEGSELQLFTHNPHVWLPRVKNIAIELHGQRCEAAFFMALRTYNYEMKVSHDTVICNNISPKH